MKHQILISLLFILFISSCSNSGKEEINRENNTQEIQNNTQEVPGNINGKVEISEKLKNNVGDINLATSSEVDFMMMMNNVDSTITNEENLLEQADIGAIQKLDETITFDSDIEMLNLRGKVNNGNIQGATE